MSRPHPAKVRWGGVRSGGQYPTETDPHPGPPLGGRWWGWWRERQGGQKRGRKVRVRAPLAVTDNRAGSEREFVAAHLEAQVDAALAHQLAGRSVGGARTAPGLLAAPRRILALAGSRTAVAASGSPETRPRPPRVPWAS